MQGFLSSNTEISANKTTDYIQLPYLIYHVPILTTTATFCGLGIIELILFYICILIYPMTEKRDPEKENQNQQKINFFLLTNLVLTIFPLIFILHLKIGSYNVFLKMILFVALINFIIPLGIFTVRIKPLIALEPDVQEIDKLSKLTELINIATRKRKKR